VNKTHWGVVGFGVFGLLAGTWFGGLPLGLTVGVC
jgi:hypothetical protein